MLNKNINIFFILHLFTAFAFILIHMKTDEKFSQLARGWKMFSGARVNSELEFFVGIIMYTSAVASAFLLLSDKKIIKKIIRILALILGFVGVIGTGLSFFLWGFGMNPTMPVFLVIIAGVWSFYLKSNI